MDDSSLATAPLARRSRNNVLAHPFHYRDERFVLLLAHGARCRQPLDKHSADGFIDCRLIIHQDVAPFVPQRPGEGSTKQGAARGYQK